MRCETSFVLALVLCLLLRSSDVHAWMGLGGNIQRNGNVPSAKVIPQAPNRSQAAWFFHDPNGDVFIGSPLVDETNDAVYVKSSSHGFLYGLNLSTGEMNWRSCIGIPPPFPDGPCKKVEWSGMPYEEAVLLDDGDLVVLRGRFTGEAEEMVRVSKTDGSVVWRYKIGYIPSDGHHSSYAERFESIPSPIQGKLFFWVSNSSAGILEMQVVSQTTGTLLYKVQHLSEQPTQNALAPFAFDPVTKGIVSEWENDQESCSSNYDQYMKCNGFALYNMNGSKVWNFTLEESYATWAMIDTNARLVHVSTTQLNAYGFNLDKGRPVYRVRQTTTTNDQRYGGVCSNGNVVLNELSFFQGWAPKGSLNPKDLWWVNCDYCSWAVATTGDGHVYVMCGQVLKVHSCVNGTKLWWIDFGGSSPLNRAANPALTSSGDLIVSFYDYDKGTGAVTKLKGLSA